MNFRKLLSDFSVAIFAQGISMVMSVLTTLLVPKILGVREYGYWQLFLFYANYVGFFHLGLNDGIYLLYGGKTRDEIDKRSIKSQFLFGVSLQLIFALVVCAFAFQTQDDKRKFVIIMTAIFLLINNSSYYFGYVFQAMNETKIFSYTNIIARGLFFVPLAILLLFQVRRFECYVAFYSLAAFVSLIYCFFQVSDFFNVSRLNFRDTARETWRSIRVGSKLMVANIASMLILGITRVEIDNAWGIEVFGKISLSLSLVSFFILFVNQASMVLFPALRRAARDELRFFYEKIRDGLAITLPIVYVLYFPMVWILSYWLPQYTESLKYFALFLPVCVFDSKMNICCTTYFKVLRREKQLLLINIGAVALSFVLSSIGAYQLHSLRFTIFSAVFVIIVRSLISEIIMNRILSVAFRRLAVEEIVLTLLFLIIAIFKNLLAGFVYFLFAYTVYLLLNRKMMKSLILGIIRAYKIRNVSVSESHKSD